MSQKTTSDQLKEVFSQHGGGDEKDWKRISKKKNLEGQWVREFKNRESGVRLEVIETSPGQFKTRSLTSEANNNFANQETLTRAPAIETDPVKNAAADKVIEALLDPHSDDEEEDDIPQKLIKKAGQALANRFVFAIGGGSKSSLQDGLFVEFSPKGSDYDQHLSHVIGHLLPKGHGGELLELTFDFSSWSDPVKLASDLMKKGFVWDEGYQSSLDMNTGDGYLTTLKMAFEDAEIGASEKEARPPPASVQRRSGPP